MAHYGYMPYVVVEVYEGKEYEQARFEFRSDAVEWCVILNDREAIYPRKNKYTFGVRTLELKS